MPPSEPRSPAPPIDSATLEAALFGERDPQAAPARRLPEDASRRARRQSTYRNRRIGVAVVAVLLVIGIGGATYAFVGTGGDTSAPPPKVEVRGTSVTTGAPQSTTTSAPTTTSPTPTTTKAPVTNPTPRSPATAPQEPVVTEPPVVAPPATTTSPTTTSLP